MEHKIKITYISTCDKTYYNLHIELFGYNRLILVRKQTDRLYIKYNDYINGLIYIDKPLSWQDGEGGVLEKLTSDCQEELKEMIKQLANKL